MNDILAVLFDFNGRIGRGTWLLFAVLLFGAEAAVEAVLNRTVFATAPLSEPYTYLSMFEDKATICGSLIFLWPSLAIDVKRWHDLGKSGFYTLIAYGPMAIIAAAELAGSVSQASMPDPLAIVLLDVSALTALIYFIILAARKGTPGANRFGPAP